MKPTDPLGADQQQDETFVKKEKYYPRVIFDSQTFFELDKALGQENKYSTLAVDFDDARWSYDTFAEFLAATDQGKATLSVTSSDGKRYVWAHSGELGTNVTVTAPTRSEIGPPKVFIGHGRNQQWRDLKDHLHEKHGYAIVAYEIGSRAGHAVRDILEEMLDESSFALLVMTGEDRTRIGRFRARQNVVHEAGLFQGHLGFSRAIILREKGTEEFSNLAGLQEIRFPKGRIAETFGEVLAVLKREFG